MSDSVILQRDLISGGELVFPPLDPIFNDRGMVLPRRQMLGSTPFSVPPVVVIDSEGVILNRRELIPSGVFNAPVIPPTIQDRGFELLRFTEDISTTSDTRVLSRRLTLIPNFYATPTSGDNPLTVQFSDLTIGGTIDSWLWDFGDGGSSTEQDPEYTYNSAGIYSVTLTVFKYPGSLSVSKTSLIVVHLVPDFSVDPTVGLVGVPFQFYDESSDPAETWDWDFGDGSTHSYDQNPTHIYNNVGYYTVTMTVTKNGFTYVKTKVDVVAVGVNVEFHASSTLGYSPFTVSFFDDSLGEPNTWHWNFGDGSPHSYEQNPTHVYTQFGSYNVTLTVSNYPFSDTETKERYITVITRNVPIIPTASEYGGGFTRLNGPTLIFD